MAASIRQQSALLTPAPATARAPVPAVAVPDHEDVLSSRAWLKRYSLKRQRLDIDAFVKEVAACMCGGR